MRDDNILTHDSDGCPCPCHRFRGVVHVVACCDRIGLGVEIGVHLKLTWNEYFGPDFRHYELERSEGGMGWYPIAIITQSSTVTYTDFESKPATQISYRVRVAKTGVNFGGWVMLQPELA